MKEREFQKWRNFLENEIPIIENDKFITGILGGQKPSEYSLSPAIWSFIFDEFKIPGLYLPFDVSSNQLENFIRSIKKDKQFRGMNVTTPYKKYVLDYVDSVEEPGESLETVNTIVAHDGKLIGLNTDGEGFLLGFEEQFGSIKSKKVLIIGAGETATSICYKVIQAGASLRIANRTIERASLLAQKLQKALSLQSTILTGEEGKIVEWAPDSDIIINTTTKGFSDLEDFSSISTTSPDNQQQSLEIVATVPKTSIFIDVIYTPRETVMLKQARQTGHRTQNGLQMLAYQALLSFEEVFAQEIQNCRLDRKMLFKLIRETLDLRGRV